MPPTRAVDDQGAVTLRAGRCEMRVTRPAAGVQLVAISGHDAGEIGAAIFDELRADLVRYPPVTLFVDLSGASGAVIGVQDQWTAWFADNRRALREVHILTSGTYLKFAADVVKHWSRTGELIRVHADRDSFMRALRQVAPSAGS